MMIFTHKRLYFDLGTPFCNDTALFLPVFMLFAYTYDDDDDDDTTWTRRIMFFFSFSFHIFLYIVKWNYWKQSMVLKRSFHFIPMPFMSTTSKSAEQFYWSRYSKVNMMDLRNVKKRHFCCWLHFVLSIYALFSPSAFES